MPRHPFNTDFPNHLKLDIVSPRNGTCQNVLILLHGLGDTQSAYTTLAYNLNLPNTAAISLCGPMPIPSTIIGSDVPCYHWASDVMLDESTGDLDLDGDFRPGLRTLGEVLAVLKRPEAEGGCGFMDRHLFFYGFGQGAMLAIAMTALHAKREFGGVVAVAGTLPRAGIGYEMSKTPLLICCGHGNRSTTEEAIARAKDRFMDMGYVKWTNGGNLLPEDRQEMLPIMALFARRLQTRAGAPGDAIEL